MSFDISKKRMKNITFVVVGKKGYDQNIKICLLITYAKIRFNSIKQKTFSGYMGSCVCVNNDTKREKQQQMTNKKTEIQKKKSI